MKKFFLLSFLVFIITSIYLFKFNPLTSKTISGAPPYDASDSDYVTESEEERLLKDWKRPDVPTKVALQVGHWKNDEVPDELHKLRGNTGATGDGMSEWEVNYEIARLTKEFLEEKGITVELLPATVPKSYWADVFVAIHADGSEDTTKSGYKAATSRRNTTGTADELVEMIETSYENATGLEKDPLITRNMRGYYAFSYWRFEHAVHPMTASAILETGFLTNPSDRDTIVDSPEISAQGLADGILTYLTAKDLLKS